MIQRDLLVACVVGLLALFSVGCGSQAGETRFRLLWPDDPDAPARVFVRGRVRLGGGGVVEATSVGPVDFGASVGLVLGNVPNGVGHVAIVEVTETATTTNVRYFAESEPFEIAPGLRHTVDLVLTAGPSLLDTSIELVGVPEGRTNDPRLTLRVRTRGARSIDVAQDFLFAQGLASFALRGSADADGFVTEEIAYDLNARLPQCRAVGGAYPAQCEGLRQVFLRAVGDDRVSDTRSRALFLDTKRPEVGNATVQYQPGPLNPLPRVERATDGTVVFVNLAFSEPLDLERRPLALVGVSGEARLEFSPVAELVDGLTAAEWRATIDADVHVDGTYALMLEIADVAGNENAAPTLPTVMVDVTAEPLVIDQIAVSYVRAPIGRAVPEDLGGFTLPATLGYFALAPADPWASLAHLPIETFALVDGVTPTRLRISADAAGLELLRSVAPTEAGWARESLQLPGLDVPRVFVAGVDGAGNVSAPVAIEQAWFVASTGVARDGSTPHRVSTARRAEPPNGAQEEVFDRAALTAPNGRGVSTRAQHDWRRWTSGAPTPRSASGIAYDAGRDRVVLFGGASLGLESDTWVFDGAGWTDVTPNQRPPGRGGASMAYDRARDQVVMFGGDDRVLNGGAVFRDTWVWDGARWTEVGFDGAPLERMRPVLVYDEQRAYTVLFGGVRPDNTLAQHQDTWIWEGRAWREIEAPGPTVGLGGAYHEGQGRVLLVTSEPETTVWAWRGDGWDVVSTSTSGPTAASGSLTYDRARDALVFFDGAMFWSWDGRTWHAEPVDSARPSPRGDTAMTSDARGPLLFGGACTGACVAGQGTNISNETWRRTVAGWVPLVSTSATPGPRYRHRMVYDDLRERVLMLGGVASAPVTPDLWAWTGAGWIDLTATSTIKPTVALGGLAYDSDRDRVVFLAAGAMETWEFDGAAWSRRQPAASPPPRTDFSLVYDAANQRTVLFGGGCGGPPFDPCRLDDQWAWDGATWSAVIPAGPVPPARVAPAIVFDPAGARVVMVGGDLAFMGAADLSMDVWIWDGASWTEPTQRAPGWPPARSDPAAAVDVHRGRVTIFGGFGRNTGFHQDTWEWDLGANAWTPIQVATVRPTPRIAPAMAYDAARRQHVLYGGFDLVPPGSDQTWLLDPPRQASVQFSPELPADLDRAALTDVRVVARCGGGADADAGAELVGWTGAWTRLATNTASVGATGADTSMSYRPNEDAPRTARSLVGPGPRMHFQCRPRVAGAGGDVAVGLDYAEVRVGYSTR